MKANLNQENTVTIHKAAAHRPHHHVATHAAKPAPKPAGLNLPRPRHDAFNPKPANKPAVPEGWATIMPITTPDSAKATPVLRYEAKQARMGLISAAMRGDTAGMMKFGQRLGQLQQTLEARGAQMFPSNLLSLANYIEGFKQFSDDQMLGERSDHFQQLLVGGLQMNNGVVSNSTQRLGAVQDEIDARGGLGLGELGELFESLTSPDLTSLVGGLLGGASEGGDIGNMLSGLLNPLGGLFGGQGGAQESSNGGGDIGNVIGGLLNPLGGLLGGQGGAQESSNGGGDIGNVIGGLLGGQGGGQPSGGGDIGNVLMGFLNPVGALLGGAQGGGSQEGGLDKVINGAASGLMEMASRGIGGIFQNVFGGLFG